MAVMGALQDPELAPLVMKLVSKINPQIGAMLGGMGGMFGQQWAFSYQIALCHISLSKQSFYQVLA